MWENKSTKCNHAMRNEEVENSISRQVFSGMINV